MDKKELVKLLNMNNKKDPLWVEAFDLYKESVPQSDLHIECRSCRTTVLNWLKRG